MRHCKKAYRRVPRIKGVRKRLTYHGYEIKVVNNNSRHPFRFEYLIKTPQNSVLRDPTSHRSIKMALMCAKEDVSASRTPRFYLHTEFMNHLRTLGLDEYNA